MRGFFGATHRIHSPTDIRILAMVPKYSMGYLLAALDANEYPRFWRKSPSSVWMRLAA
jgi:hypothetical protein